jgi:hypothetical protein
MCGNYSMTGTNENLIQKEIKRGLNSGNVYYHSVQNLSSSHPLLKDVKIRIYKILILLVVLYWCEEYSLNVLEKRVLRKIFG